MAGLFQLGDIIQISRAAWELYKFGWDDNLNAATQFGRFGQDVKGLAESLDGLRRMITSAYEQVRGSLGSHRAPRWNFASLNEIIGDYQRTIHECRRLVESNRQYGQAVGPWRNIEWNILIQPQAAALQQRILHHNSKILIIIKPLEIDLLSQIISRLDDVHGQVQRVIGILTSDIPQAVRQQEQQLSHTLDCPPDIAARFQSAAGLGPATQRSDPSRPLSDLTEAFLLHLRQSTINFLPEATLEARIAPGKEYINLLKCVWLMAQIEQHPDLLSANDDSHWPSYVKGLKAELSRECWRFDARSPEQVLPPDLRSLNNIDFSIWPVKAPEPILPPIVQLPAAMMDELLNVTMASPRPSLVHHFRLLRGVNGKMSAVISAVDYENEEERRDSRTLDFNIESAGLIPLYAVSFDQGPLSVILKTESVMAELAFRHVDELLRFQRALTGYKVYQDYTQPSVVLELIMSDRKEPGVHTAHVQLWIAKELDGRVSTGPGSDSELDSSSRRASIVSTRCSPTIPSPGGESNFNVRSMPPNADPLINRLSHFNIGHRQAWHNGVPSCNGVSPGRGLPRPFPNHAPLSPQRVNRAVSMASIQTATSASMTRESHSIFSTQSKDSRSTSTKSRKLASPDLGTGRGYVYQKPMEPLLVLLLKSTTDPTAQVGLANSTKNAPQPFSVVIIQLDENTAPNYERCSCQNHPSHPYQCDVTALERDKGKQDLSARIIEADELEAWDLMRLRPSNRQGQLSADASAAAAFFAKQPKPLPKLRRVTLTFPDVQSRYRLSGRPCSCNKTRTTAELKACLEAGHQGLLGRVRQYHKKELDRFEEAQRKKQDVVMGPMASV
ncbi:hypothetical protein A1O7_09867 [Cladophialophora yegresii CBS 114405]|uniref:Uncharacterized protein n=1 Tax=Cladophialophora yegresii CBS 114405 TaxID=1182544 RepID=W9VFW4_9EURO|nr:uncharacterized protein A1O7_09867 [Cladophialophora yegresii CBS 114405]EXJ54527.1 hypothetical protein A1O7_09867 [Cladophialophora yegresii CBS 114405]